MQVLFRFIVENPQVSACKACKMGYPFRDVPQFIPENQENQRNASIFANSFSFVSMLEWA